MARRYFTTNKAGEEVEVSRELALELIDAGKKQLSDFEFEEEEVAVAPEGVTTTTPFEATTGLQNIPFTTANLEAQQARQEQFEGLSEAQKLQFAEALGKGVQTGFEEIGQPDAKTLEMQGGRELRKSLFEEKQKRRERGELTTSEKLLDVAFTEDVTTDPEVAVGGPEQLPKILGGASSIFARGLGALVGKGEITAESTKLLKGSIESWERWAQDPDNQGLADQAAALTATTLLEIGSDPTAIFSGIKNLFKIFGRNVSRSTAKNALKKAQKLVGETSDKLKSLGIDNPKMLGIIDAQPGATVREKLANIKARQPGATTTAGRIESAEIEQMFGGGKVDELLKNVDAIEVELEALKGTEKQALERVSRKAKSRKRDIEESRRAEEFGIEEEAATRSLETEIAGERLKEGIAAGTKEQVEAVPSAIDTRETVEAFTREGKFSGRGINQAFEEAEALAKTGKIDVNTRKSLTEEMIAAAEGDVDRITDYSDVVKEIFKIRKDAPLADYRRVLMKQDINPEFAESFRRIKQGTANDLIASKRSFNKILSKEGVALDDTMKRAADQFKQTIDGAVEGSLGEDAYQKLRGLQDVGGKESSARKRLLKVMKINPKESEIVSDIDFNDAITNLDEFIDKAAQKYAKTGSHPDMVEGGRFPEWKKFFGIDVEQEVKNRAKKLTIAEEGVTATKGVEAATKESLGRIKIDKQKALKNLSRDAEDAKRVVDDYASLSKDQLQKGFSRRTAEIKRALKDTQDKVGKAQNVASDFAKEVKHFATDGNFSKNTESFKAFESKYGSKLANLIPDQAVLEVLDVSSKGKVVDLAKTQDALRGMRAPTQAVQAVAFAEGATNRIIKKIKPFEKRLNKTILKIKSKNKELAKELNRIRKRGGDVEESFELLLEKQPFATMDLLSQEFKFINPLDFMDEAFITGVANGTIRGYTNRERASAKRIENRL